MCEPLCVYVCVCVTMCVSKLDPSNHEGQCLAPLCTALVQWGGSLHSLAAVKQQGGWGVWRETGSRLSVQQYFSICPQIVIFSISIKSMFPWQPTHFLSGWIVFHTVATLLWYVLLSLILFFVLFCIALYKHKCTESESSVLFCFSSSPLDKVSTSAYVTSIKHYLVRGV